MTMIYFFNEDCSFNYKGKNLARKWLRLVAASHGMKIGDLNVIFCSDPYLLDINVKYLGHNYYTDIITFDSSEKPRLSGDLFISVDTVRANAEYYEQSFDDEINRVIVHGLLHLIGYDDHADDDITLMRAKENSSLELLYSLRKGEL